MALILYAGCGAGLSASGLVAHRTAHGLGGSTKAVQSAVPRDVRRLGNGWVETRASVLAPSDQAPSEARERALAKARRRSVEAVAGITVTSGFLSFKALRDQEASDLVQSLNFVRSEAVIVDERVMDQRMVPIADDNGYLMEVVLRARVVDRRRGTDPGFFVKADLGRERFLDGEEVTLTVRSTRAARIYVVQVNSGGATLLLPNTWLSDTRVQAGEVLRFPGPRLRARGIRVLAQARAGGRPSLECLVVVALRGDREFPGLHPSGGRVFRQEDAEGAGRLVGALLGPLADVPVADWAIYQVPYEVIER